MAPLWGLQGPAARGMVGLSCAATNSALPPQPQVGVSCAPTSSGGEVRCSSVRDGYGGRKRGMSDTERKERKRGPTMVKIDK